MVELAVGGGLALFLYLLQHESSKKQRQIWNSQQIRIYNDIVKICSTIYLACKGINHKLEKISEDESVDIIHERLEKIQNMLESDKEFISGNLYDVLKSYIKFFEKTSDFKKIDHDELSRFDHKIFDLAEGLKKYDKRSWLAKKIFR